MGGVGLYEAGFGDGRRGFGGVVEVDGAVGGAGEDLGVRGLVGWLGVSPPWAKLGDAHIGLLESCM